MTVLTLSTELARRAESIAAEHGYASLEEAVSAAFDALDDQGALEAEARKAFGEAEARAAHDAAARGETVDAETVFADLRARAAAHGG